tara:strand:+ start:8497 stop:8760 length:264 start_codon:yes stop_codon:yes gene_type:complete
MVWVDVANAVFFELKVAKNRARGDMSVNDGADVMFESWECCFGGVNAPTHMPISLYNQDRGACFGKVPGTGKAIVASTNDNKIVVHS